MKALHNVRLDASPIGPVRIDEYGKPILNIYVRKVERKDGRLVNSIVATYKDVSQFWSSTRPSSSPRRSTRATTRPPRIWNSVN